MPDALDPFAEIDPGAIYLGRTGAGKTLPKGRIEMKNATADPRETITSKDVALAAVQRAETGTVMASRVRAADFAPRGDVMPMAELAGQELDLWDVELQKTRFGEALKLTLSYPAVEVGELPTPFYCFTSGVVVKKALEAVHEQVVAGALQYPLAVKFVMIGGADQSYWTLE